MESLRDLTFKMDNELGLIGCNIETLSDMEMTLSQLVDDMGQTATQGLERAYYHEHFRMVRLLSKLMRYTVKELDKNFEKAHDIHSNMFNEIVEDQQKAI